MTEKHYKEVTKKLEVIITNQTKHSEGLVRIDEHLKTLNGTVTRHDKCLEKLEVANDTQWSTINRHIQSAAEFRGMVNAKLTMVGLGSGSFVAIIAWLLKII